MVIDMPTFSQRIGLAPVRFEPQTDRLDQSTRTALWNWLHQLEEHLNKGYRGKYVEGAYRQLWRDSYEFDLSSFTVHSARNQLKTILSKGEWHQALTIVEDYVNALERSERGLGNALSTRINEDVFTRYLVGYRFVDFQLVPITDDLEIASVNDAITNQEVPDNARSHLKKAIALLSSRENPNYGKAMDESLEAVEAAVHSLTGKKVLSEGLKMLKRGECLAHPALVQAWDKMYAWASDDGIRHAEFRDVPKDQATAVYVLVTCSAFVNYLASASNLNVDHE